MEFDIISNEKRELSVGLIRHVTRRHVKFALPFSVEYSWDNDVLGNRHTQLIIDFLCFSFYIEYWGWGNE